MYLMLQTKFLSHRSTGSGEEELCFLTTYGHGGKVGHLTLAI